MQLQMPERCHSRVPAAQGVATPGAGPLSPWVERDAGMPASGSCRVCALEQVPCPSGCLMCRFYLSPFLYSCAHPYVYVPAYFRRLVGGTKAGWMGGGRCASLVPAVVALPSWVVCPGQDVLSVQFSPVSTSSGLCASCVVCCPPVSPWSEAGNRPAWGRALDIQCLVSRLMCV